MRLVTLTQGDKRTTKSLFITSDNVEYSNLEQADWHEYTVCQLNQRILDLSVPEHTIMDFEDKKTLERYLKEDYHCLAYEVVSDIEHIVFPAS